MSALPSVLRVRCHYCSKGRDPNEALHLSGGVVMCWQCYERHLQALHSLSTGEPPKECPECHTSFEQFPSVNDSGDIRMYAHYKDGFYQLLCERCSNRYVGKRKDLYGDTQYGWKRKLK